MQFRHLVAVAAVFVGLASRPAMATAAEACQLKLASNLPMTVMGNGGTMLVPGKIGDRTIRMLFDTGASRTVIEGQIALQLGIRLSTFPSMRMAGVGGEAQVWNLGGIPIVFDRLMTLAPAFATNPATLLYRGAFDAILGADAMQSSDFEVDPQSRRINLFLSDHCPGQVVYWATEYSMIPFKWNAQDQIEVGLKLNGQNFKGLIDTGNSQTAISWKAAKDHFGLTTISPGVTAHGKTYTADGRTIDVAQYTFDTLEFGDLKIRHAVVNLLEQYSTNAVTDILGIDDWAPQVTIGMDVLKHLRLYVAANEGVIYFTVVPPSDTAPAAPS